MMIIGGAVMPYPIEHQCVSAIFPRLTEYNTLTLLNIQLMKRKFIILGLVLSGLGGVCTSCSDDETVTTLPSVVIETEMLQRGITTDMQSAVIDVPIQCEGRWSAVVDADCDWADLSDHDNFYSGNRTLRLIVDENHTNADRKTVLYVGDANGDIFEIPVMQTALYKGEAPSNGGSGQWFADNGVGYGVNYNYVLNPDFNREGMKFEPTKMKMSNNIFNIAQIEALQRSTDSANRLKSSAYVETPIQLSTLHDLMIDSTLCQNKHLEATVRLECSFGFLEFTAEGSYNSTKKENRAHIDYSILRNAPTYNVTLSPAEIRAYAEARALIEDDELTEEREARMEEIDALEQKWLDNKTKRGKPAVLTKSEEKKLERMRLNVYQPTYGNVFSDAFAQRYYQLQYYFDEGDFDKANDVLAALDSDYGPFFISGGDFGGNMNIYAKVDTLFLEGSSSLSASLSAELAMGIQVGGEVTFTDEGVQLFRNSDITIAVYGGSAAQTQNELSTFFGSDDLTNHDKLQSILSGWVESLQGRGEDNVPSQAAPIRYNFTPIWTLFSDPSVSNYAMEYFLKKYKDMGINTYLGMMNGNQFKGEDLLNR